MQFNYSWRIQWNNWEQQNILKNIFYLLVAELLKDFAVQVILLIIEPYFSGWGASVVLKPLLGFLKYRTMFLISVLKDYYGAQQILSRPAETLRLRKQLCSQDLPNLSWVELSCVWPVSSQFVLYLGSYLYRSL